MGARPPTRVGGVHVAVVGGCNKKVDSLSETTAGDYATAGTTHAATNGESTVHMEVRAVARSAKRSWVVLWLGAGVVTSSSRTTGHTSHGHARFTRTSTPIAENGSAVHVVDSGPSIFGAACCSSPAHTLRKIVGDCLFRCWLSWRMWALCFSKLIHNGLIAW